MVLQQLLGANAGVPGWVPVRGQLQRQVPVLLRHPPHLPASTARHLHHPRRACHSVTVSRRSGTVPSAASRDRSRSQHFGIPGKHGSLSRAVLRQVGHRASRNHRSGALLRRQSLPSCAGPRHRAWEAPIDRASHSCIIHHKPEPAWAQWAWRNNPAFSVQACMPSCVRMRVDSWRAGPLFDTEANRDAAKLLQHRTHGPREESGAARHRRGLAWCSMQKLKLREAGQAVASSDTQRGAAPGGGASRRTTSVCTSSRSAPRNSCASCAPGSRGYRVGLTSSGACQAVTGH